MSTEFDSMSIDELWDLHEELAKALAARITSEKAVLEDRLKQLTQTASGVHQTKSSVPAGTRRPYPTVVPKYQNPEDTSETWSGRGKQPRWLVALLTAGKAIDDFRISSKPVAHSSNITTLGKREAS
jgi:DNA-binding protein H-NS